MQVFNIFEEFGSVVSSRFKNAVGKKANGGSENIIYWRNPLLQFDLSKAIFYQSLADYLYEFLREVKGTKETFLYLDPTDYLATSTPYNTELGVTTQGILYPSPNGTNTEFQLYKLYTLGENKIRRAIANPRQETTIFINGNPTPATININTGKVTFNTPPATNSTLTWDGQFYVLLRFESSENIGIETQVYDEEQDETIYQLPNVKLVEVKEELSLLNGELKVPKNSIDTEGLIDHIFALDFSYDSILQPIYQTEITPLDSGFEGVKSQGSMSLAKVRLGGQNLYWNEIQYLIGLWRIVYGNALSFTMPEYTNYSTEGKIITRFLSDNLSIKILRDDEETQDKLFNVEGLELTQTGYYDTPPYYHVFGTYISKNESEAGERYWRSVNHLIGSAEGLSITPDCPEYDDAQVFRLMNFYDHYVEITPCSDSQYEEDNLENGNNFRFNPFLVYVPPTANNMSLSGGVPGYGHSLRITKVIEISNSNNIQVPNNFRVNLCHSNCYCHAWLIERKDGLKIGTTDHDTPFEFEEVLYLPQIGFKGDAVPFKNTPELTNSNITSIISNTITETDLLLRKYEGATLEIWIWNWLESEKVRTIFIGSLGELKVESGAILDLVQVGNYLLGGNAALRFTHEAQSIHLKLSQKATLLTSKTCRHTFGGQGAGKCNKDLSALTDTYTINASESNRFTVSNSSRPSGFFNEGKVTFISGFLQGTTIDVATWDGSTFSLWQPLPFPPGVGDTIVAVAGCAKTMEACIAYNNIDYFGGQSYVPGVDRLIEGSGND